MSEVETAWAPSGALMYEHSDRVNYIPKDAIPAVLRALIAQAGGVEVEVRRNHWGVPAVCSNAATWHYSTSKQAPDGRYLLLPMEGSE